MLIIPQDLKNGVYLNESPSEKEGKWRDQKEPDFKADTSMKVPPKRKGNFYALRDGFEVLTHLNESPSEKEGKFTRVGVFITLWIYLNESPSEKEGKLIAVSTSSVVREPQ